MEEGLDGKYIQVSWLQSKIASKEMFHWRLLGILPSGVEMEGVQERCLDGTIRYDALVHVRDNSGWAGEAEDFRMEGDTTEVFVEKAKAGQRLVDFVEDSKAYCSRFDDTFGAGYPRTGKYMNVWGVGASGAYVYIVAIDREQAGYKGLSGESPAWKPKDYKAWFETGAKGDVGIEAWRRLRVGDITKVHAE